jgi:hypothetical protein
MLDLEAKAYFLHYIRSADNAVHDFIAQGMEHKTS